MNRNALKAKTAWVQSRAFARPVNQVALASGEEGRRKITCARISLTFGDLGRVFFERRQTQREKTKVLHPRRSPDLDDLSASSVSHRHSVLSQAPTLIRGRLNPARNIAYWLVVGLRHQTSTPFESGEEHRKPAQRWMPSRAHLRRRSSSTKNIAIPLRVVQGEATFIRRLLALAVQLQYGVVCPRLKPWFISQGRKTSPVHLDVVRVRAIDQGSVREPLRHI